MACTWSIKATAGEVIVGERKWREAHKNGTEEGSEGKMRPKHSGDDRGVSVAQERRRCQDGQRDVLGACRCSRRRRVTRTQKLAENGLKRRKRHTQARAGMSGQSGRERNETNEVVLGGRTEGCNDNDDDDNDNDNEQQQRGTSSKVERQWRRSENRQLQRRQWIQQGGQQEEGRW